MSCVSRDSLIFFPFHRFIYFSCSVALTRASSTMFNWSSKTKHLFLVPGLRKKALSLASLSMMVAVFLFLKWIHFIKMKFSSIPSLVSIFIMSRFWISLNAFSPSLRWLRGFCSCSETRVHYIDIFLNVPATFHSWDKSHLVMVYNPFNILLASVLVLCLWCVWLYS
jgi:hypothetical protein